MPTDYTTEPARAALRERLAAYRIDDPQAAFPFSARLARENGWTRGHTLRVLEEYHRFLYLAMTAGHPVSPSQQVDEAWHLHLLYTRSYWEDLVPHVLGRPLHHGPTRGGGAERAKFDDWYARTLASYRAAFGAEPPADIWPAPEARFAPAAPTRQVSTATHWVIRKPAFRGFFRTATATALILILAGCAAAEEMGTRRWFMILAAGAVIAIFAVLGSSPAPAPHRRAGPHARATGRASQTRGATRTTFSLDALANTGTLWDGDGGSCDGGGGSCGSGCGGGCGGCGD